MIELIDEFGARLFLPVNAIKYFKENIGGVGAATHKQAISIIETVQGDIFYLSDTVDDIIEKLLGGRNNENQQ